MKAVENEKAYNIEYTVRRSDEDQRHLLSTVAIGFNGRLVIYMCMAVLGRRCDHSFQRSGFGMRKSGNFLQVYQAVHADSSELTRQL